MLELARGNPTLAARLRLWTLLNYENKAIVEMQNIKQKIVGIIGFDIMKEKNRNENRIHVLSCSRREHMPRN